MKTAEVRDNADKKGICLSFDRTWAGTFFFEVRLTDWSWVDIMGKDKLTPFGREKEKI